MATRAFCKRHPEIDTRLSCGVCKDPICPRCMVHSHVGVRCPECGRVATPPTYEVGTTYLARAAAAAMAVGAAAGLIYGFLFAASGLIAVVVMAGIGYLVAEAATLAANRKRGRPVQYAAAAGLLVCLIVVVIVARSISAWVLLGFVAAVLIGTGRLR